MGVFKLNRMGFITNYLIAGPKETDFISEDRDDNQLRYEQHLRTIVTNWEEKQPEQEIRLGETSKIGMPWRYYYHYGNWFVDESIFYSTLQKVELMAVTRLDVKGAKTVRAAVWSYAAVDVWCGGKRVCRIEEPVYKPISRKETVLELKNGSNQIVVYLQTLGVRDTRTLFGIQLLEGMEDITVSLPDEEHTEVLAEAEGWLAGLKLKDSVLSFESQAPKGTWMAYDSQSLDIAKVESRKEWQEISGKERLVLDSGKPGVILISIRSEYGTLTRTVENILAQRPLYSDVAGYEENKQKILERIADMKGLTRGDRFGFYISNILARKALGRENDYDNMFLCETLKQIESRYDCSDFLVCGLVRYIKNYSLDETLSDRVRQVLLNWRYWMDQNGSDAMCFWSENHALMFYTCAMNVGELYPDDFFVRAGMTGRELSRRGRCRVKSWLTDVETHGFEEFLSTVYMCVTFAALLNVVDYSEPEISRRAVKVTDELLRMLCRHTFDGVVIAPMGRVYREVVHPFAQGAQALMNLIDPSVPYSFGEGWLGAYATSTYKLPDDLRSLMEQPVDTEYATGNALIRLNKNEHYCLTSVQSPRRHKPFWRWENLTLNPDADTSSCEYTKSLNERFHGTTCFEPGVYGYQQHMWYAALDKETDVFTNHPGGTCDSSSMRPGFWYGNGVMPAIVQEGRILGVIYRIPEEHPIHFTHLYFPTVKFDETRVEENWVFGRKKHGYVAVWCSGVMEPADDQLFGCEYRTYGDETAYLCVCGDAGEFKSLEAFCVYAKGLSPDYKPPERELTAKGLRAFYTENEDKTQNV